MTERYYVWLDGKVRILVYEYKNNQEYLRIEPPIAK